VTRRPSVRRRVRALSVAIATIAIACALAPALARHGPQPPPAPFDWHAPPAGHIPNLPRPLSGHAAGVSHGRLLVAGGSDFPTSMFEGGKKIWLDEIYAFDRGAQAWRVRGRLPQPLAYAAVAVVDDKVILAGGSDGTRDRREVIALEWIGGEVRQTALPSLPAPIAMAGAGVLGRTLFVVGGEAEPGVAPALDTVWTLDLSSTAPAWRAMAPLPAAGRILPVVSAQAGRLHVFSGAALERTGAGVVIRRYLRDGYAWAPESGWRRLTDAPHPIVAAPAIAAGQSQVVVFGGDTGADVMRVAELKDRHPGFSREIVAYDTIADTWTPLGDLPAGLVTTTAIAFEGRTLIVGGEDRPGHRSAKVLSAKPIDPGRATAALDASYEQSSTSAPPQTDVFIAGEDGSHTYRIPSIIATQKGTLLAFAEARRSGAADAGDIDLVLRRSRDGGASWSPIAIVADAGPDTVGNPCPVVDAQTGTVWLLTTRNRGVDKERDIIAGTSQGSRTVWVMRSDDDGVTWSTPLEITSSVKQPDWTWYATGPGVGIQMTSGRLVIPANHAEAGTAIHRSHIVFSDDHGAHWQVGASAEAGTNESQVVELGDGRLMLNMRNHPPRPENYRLVATSADGGRTLSSSVADRALVEPPAQAGFIRVPARGSHAALLLFANPASTKRERMTVRVSDDEGRSWANARVVHEGPAAYSGLVSLPDRAIGLLYERGDRSPYERITFARLTLDWIRERTTR
jgi:sialidase-1